MTTTLQSLRQSDSIRLGVFIGAVFGVWNLVLSMLDPLADDTPLALLEFYGPMFLCWGFAGFRTFRRTRRMWDAVKVATVVAFVTFLVYDVAVIIRVNLLLDSLAQRSDWQNLMARFQTSGFRSFRLYANWIGLAGTPFKITVASVIGAIFGTVGGLLGAASVRLADQRGESAT